MKICYECNNQPVRLNIRAYNKKAICDKCSNIEDCMEVDINQVVHNINNWSVRVQICYNNLKQRYIWTLYIWDEPKETKTHLTLEWAIYYWTENKELFPYKQEIE